MLLYITRHGESTDNAVKKHISVDAELTEYGLVCCRRLGERMASIKLDAIISSPLIRALSTAHEVCIRQEREDLKVEPLNDLMEIHTKPDYPGLAHEELCKRFPRLACFDGPVTPAGGPLCLGEEDDNAFMSRAYRVISYVKKRFPDDSKVLLVAHGSFNSRLVAAALGMGHPYGFNFSSANTALTLIRYTEGKINLSFLNDTAHLYQEGGVIDELKGFPKI